jgi:SAM-dependent methyltransferase
MKRDTPAHDALDYLCVDAFLVHLVDVQALATAFETGIIDLLAAVPGSNTEALQQIFRGEPRGLQLLLDLLQTNSVVREADGGWELKPQFRRALRYRDLLEAKIDFANIAAPDLIGHFSALLRDPKEFMRTAGMFRLFAYGKCFEVTPENLALAGRWMRITSALTRYEARICLQKHDFAPYRRMLDIGGNSGEFVLQLCRQHRELQATVFDLPVVCEVGRKHVIFEEEAERIQFVRGNVLTDRLPEGFDLVTFKSVLHDWPDREATDFLARASRSVTPGGTLLIFERGHYDFSQGTPPYSVLPFLTFAHCYRDPSVYAEQLQQLGFADIVVEQFQLEMPFFIVSGRKAGQAG